MDRLIAFLGLLVDWVLGPKQVLLHRGEVQYDSQTLRATYAGLPEKLTITSKQVMYHVKYQRSWVPDRKRSVYIVVCEIGDEFKDRFNPHLFIPQTFPILCNPLLHHTEYPHTYAIHAFLDQFFPNKRK
jgi:hypothetical protein